MKTRTKFLVGIGITVFLMLGLAVGGWFWTTAFAQGPGQGGNWNAMHDNQAVTQLLKSDTSALLAERQAGKSWLDIAAAKDVSEQALLDALMEPVTQRHAWMTQNYSQTNAQQMTEWMRQQLTQDLGATQFGTLADRHVFGGATMFAPNNRGMMGNWNGRNNFGGMMRGGMMGNAYGNGYGGMMGGWNNAPNVIATPVPSSQKIDREIQMTVSNFQYSPTQVTVKAGETVKFSIANQDRFAHNVVSVQGKLANTVLAPNQTTSIVWSAPNQPGTYTVICTWHPGMQFNIVVE